MKNITKNIFYYRYFILSWSQNTRKDGHPPKSYQREGKQSDKTFSFTRWWNQSQGAEFLSRCLQSKSVLPITSEIPQENREPLGRSRYQNNSAILAVVDHPPGDKSGDPQGDQTGQTSQIVWEWSENFANNFRTPPKMLEILSNQRTLMNGMENSSECPYMTWVRLQRKQISKVCNTL